jgi:hypothetical protein
MFQAASLKLGLDKAVLHNMQQSSGGENGKRQSAITTAMSKSEIELLLKKGAYHVFGDNGDDPGPELNIDEILEKDARVLRYDGEEKDNEGGAAGGSTFSKATFVPMEEHGAIDINDPNFWSLIGLQKSKKQALEGTRRRRATERWGMTSYEGDKAGDGAFEGPDSDDESEASEEEAAGEAAWTDEQRDAFLLHVTQFGFGRYDALRRRLLLADKTDEEIRAYECGLLAQLCTAATGERAKAVKRKSKGKGDKGVDKDTEKKDKEVMGVGMSLVASMRDQLAEAVRTTEGDPDAAHDESSGLALLREVEVDGSLRTPKLWLDPALLGMLERLWHLSTHLPQDAMDRLGAGEDLLSVVQPPEDAKSTMGIEPTTWGPRQDAALLLGTHAEGFSQYEAMRANPLLGLEAHPVLEGATNHVHSLKRGRVGRLTATESILNRRLRALLLAIGHNAKAGTGATSKKGSQKKPQGSAKFLKKAATTAVDGARSKWSGTAQNEFCKACMVVALPEGSKFIAAEWLAFAELAGGKALVKLSPEAVATFAPIFLAACWELSSGRNKAQSAAALMANRGSQTQEQVDFADGLLAAVNAVTVLTGPKAKRVLARVHLLRRAHTLLSTITVEELG